MATSLRELIVSVSADTSKYQAEMARASRMGGQYFKAVQDGGSNATRSWNTQTAAARTHATAIEANAQALTRYASVALSAFGASKLIGLADDWGQIGSRIRMTTKDSAEFESVQNRLIDIASRTYRSYNEAADQYANTANSMREMGFTAHQSLDAAEGLSLALVAGASNAQRGAAANDAWSKSMVQGRIETDQFKTLLLQTPRVVQALGDGLGKTTQQLQQMAKDGLLTANVVVPAITSQIGTLNAEVESMPTTVQDAGIRFTNELQRWVGEANDAHGATQVLVKGIELLAENIDTLGAVGGAVAVGALAGKMVQLGRAAASSAVGFVQSRVAAIAEAVAIRDATLAGQLKAQSDLRRAQAAMTAARGTADSARQSRNLAMALLTERQATQAATQAKLAYERATSASALAGRGLLAMLGGPAGLAITVGMVAAGWLLFRDNSTEATRALRDMTGPLDEVLAKYRELGAAQKAQAMIDASKQAEEAGKRARSAIGDILDANLRGLPGSGVFKRIADEVESGAITVDEGSAKIMAEIDRLGAAYVRAGWGREEQVRAAAAWEEHARAATIGRDRFEGMAEAAAQAVPATENLTQVVSAQAEAVGKSADEWAKYIGKLEDQAEVIGLSARQIAAYRATQEGFSADQAELAGVLAAKAEALQTFQKAVQDNDLKQQEAARKTLEGLVEIEAKLKGVFAEGAAAGLRVAGVFAALPGAVQSQLDMAMAGAEHRSSANSPQALLAEQLAQIRANTVRSPKAGNRSADQWRDYQQQMERAIALQDALSAAYGRGDAAVAAANRVHEIEEQVARQGEGRREQVIALIEREAEAKLKAYGADQVANLEREIAMHGLVGDAARMRFEIERGGYASLSPEHKARLQELADEKEATRAAAASLASYRALTEKYATPVERQQHEARDDSGSAWMALINGNVDSDGYDQLMKRIDDRAKSSMGNISVYADQAARNMQTTFADYLFDPMADGFDGMVDGFAEAIRRMLAEAAAAKFFEMLGGAMSAYGGQGTWGNIIRGTGAAMTKGGKAGGGEVRPNSAYDVTEHGPELLQYGGRQVLMMGAQGGVVSPLMQMRGGGGGSGGGLQVVVNNHGDNQVKAREESQQQPDGSVLRRLIIDVVGESLNGGQLGRIGKSRYGWQEVV